MRREVIATGVVGVELGSDWCVKSLEQAARELVGRLAKAELVIACLEAEGMLPRAKMGPGWVEVQAH